ENEETKEEQQQIIEQEDLNENETEEIPDPPKDESLVGDEGNVNEVEIETPASVTGEKMEGAGTVVDFTTTGARAFYTIKDNNDNTFYLMIDMDKPDNNVYFLSDVNKEQVASKSESTSNTNNDSLSILGGNENDETSEKSNTNETKEPTEKQDSTDKKEEEDSSNLSFLLIVAGIGIVGAFAYYFFVIKRKQSDNVLDKNEQSVEDAMLESYEDDDMDLGEDQYEEHDSDN